MKYTGHSQTLTKQDIQYYGETTIQDPVTFRIKDLTTYIDPTKYNYAFASQDLEEQNFWVQIGMNIQARRKMSAKIIPNL